MLFGLMELWVASRFDVDIYFDYAMCHPVHFIQQKVVLVALETRSPPISVIVLIGSGQLCNISWSQVPFLRLSFSVSDSIHALWYLLQTRGFVPLDFSR